MPRPITVSVEGCAHRLDKGLVLVKQVGTWLGYVTFVVQLCKSLDLIEILLWLS